MEYIKDMSEDMQVIFKKMFLAVGAPFNMKLVEDWYTKYSWTHKQEEEFRDWFVEYHRKNKTKGIVSKYSRSKKSCLEAWQWFNLNYGWTHKEEL